MTSTNPGANPGNVGTRVKRATLWTFLGFGGSQALRFASNLILTRLLFPEAFGLMALVQAFLVGLALFSDTGVRSSIIQNARGDDPDFLNTAWTVQIIRGAILWLGAVALAGPAAHFYGEPSLAHILPVSGLILLIQGFTPTAVHTADRHLHVGLVTMINLCGQIVSILLMIVIAYLERSVWALVMGTLIGGVLTLVAYRLFLPNARNRLLLERSALLDLFHFGKFLFLSTAAGFVIAQGDRMVLGLYLSLSELGVYNIGFFLANMAVVLSTTLTSKVVFPLYRMKPAQESAGNRAAIFRVRRWLAAGMILATALLGFAGPVLVDLLYDPRYAMAGAVTTLYALSFMPVLALDTAPTALMASGDSRRFLVVLSTTAALQFVFLLLGVRIAGIFGVILAPGLAVLCNYPIRMAYARRYGVWDPLHDFGFLLVGLTAGGMACYMHAGDLRALLP
ncbi:oligosaccharide flippase family protein [Tropicimonas sp.]|uniref:oligosaccharide flippase family protein n=1 Tax=Tropicimonas sp. TaxID=2067044 RepID=UPI003A86391B